MANGNAPAPPAGFELFDEPKSQRQRGKQTPAARRTPEPPTGFQRADEPAGDQPPLPGLKPRPPQARELSPGMQRAAETDPMGLAAGPPKRELSTEAKLSRQGVSTAGAPYAARRAGGYATDEGQKIKGLQQKLSDIFGQNVSVRRGPTSERIEFLNPETNQWTTYNPPGLDFGDVMSLEAEAMPTAGGVIGGGLGLYFGGPAGGYAGEAAGSFVGEFQRLKMGQERGMVDPERSDTNLAVEALGTAGLGLGLGLGTDALANVVRRRIGKQFGIDLDTEELKRRIQDKMEAHERVGTDPTTGQVMRGTPEGDELLTAEREARRNTATEGNRPLRERYRQNLKRGVQFLEDQTAPQVSGSRQQARQAIQDIPNIAERQLTQRLEESDALVEQTRESLLNHLAQTEDAADVGRTEIGESIRNSFRRAADQFYRTAEEEAYAPIRRAARGLSTRPVNTFQVARDYRQTIENDLIPELTRENRGILDSILDQQREPSQRWVDRFGNPMVDERGTIPEYDFNQLQRAQSVLRQAQREKSRGNLAGVEGRMLRELQAAVNSDMDRLLRQREGLADLKQARDVWYSSQKQQLYEGVVDKVMQRGSGEASYKVPPEDVLENIFRPMGESGQRQVVGIMRQYGNDDALLKLRQGLIQKWRNDVVTGDQEVDPQAHAQFVENYRTALDEILPQDMRQNIDDAAGFASQLRQKLQERDQLKRELDQTTEGKLASLNPDEIFEKTWKDPDKARRTHELLQSYDQQFADAYRWHVRQDLYDRATDRASNVLGDRADEEGVQAAARMVNPAKLEDYVEKHGDKLRQWFGGEYVDDLNMLATAMRDVTARAGEPAARNEPVNALYDFARAYVGLFTRPGRVITAFRKTKARDARRDLAEALLDPRRLARLNELAEAGQNTQKAASIMLAANVTPLFTTPGAPTDAQARIANQQMLAPRPGRGPNQQPGPGLRRPENGGGTPEPPAGFNRMNYAPGGGGNSQGGGGDNSRGRMPRPRRLPERQAVDAEQGVEPDYGPNMGFSDQLLDAVVQTESAGDPRAESPVGARGLYQIMPTTARDYGVEDPERLYDPEVSRRLGPQILRDYTDIFGGDLEKGLAAYNWGPGNVKRAVREHGDNWKRALPEETRNYLKKLRPAIRNERLRGQRAER